MPACTLVGTVSNASNQQPLENIVVTASGPSLMGEQVVITDAAGQYRIPGLPPGEFALDFSTDGYERQTLRGIRMRSAETVRVDAVLRPSDERRTEIVIEPIWRH